TSRSGLVVELRSHLQAALSRSAGDLPETGATETDVRIAPLRRILQRVGFQAQLHVFPFGDVVVLHQRRILVPQRRSNVAREETRRRPDTVRVHTAESGWVEIPVELVPHVAWHAGIADQVRTLISGPQIA